MVMSERETRRGRPLYAIEFGELERYQYFSREVIAAKLVEFGLGDSRQMVHAGYMRDDGALFVGVLHLDVESHRDHLIGLPILQGTLGVEAMEQAWVLMKMIRGEIGEGQTGRIADLDEIHFRHSVIPPADVNIVVGELLDGRAYGQIRSGETVVTDGIFRGAIMSKEDAIRSAEKRIAAQSATQPLFPFQD